MSPGCAALVLAALLAVEPRSARDAVAALHPASDTLLLQVLPPPPDTVVLDTRYFGTVTIDHRAHLARRAPCRSCHGAGPVSKIRFTPRIAHQRCLGCHEDLARGPAACAGCHVKPPPPSEPLVAESGEPPGIAQGAPTARGAQEAPAGGTAALVPSGAARPPARAPASAKPAPAPARSFGRVVEIGLSAGAGFVGPSLRVSSRVDRIVITHDLGRIGPESEARTLALMGAGVAVPLRWRWEVVAVAMGGLDAVERPLMVVLPAVGASFGIGWLPRFRGLESVHLSATGTVDLWERRAYGLRAGGPSFFTTLAMGIGRFGK